MCISNTMFRMVVFRIWFELSKEYPHIEIYNMGGEKQKPFEGTQEGFKPNKI